MKHFNHFQCLMFWHHILYLLVLYTHTQTPILRNLHTFGILEPHILWNSLYKEKMSIDECPWKTINLKYIYIYIHKITWNFKGDEEAVM